MAADPTPQSHTPMLAPPLALLTRLVVKMPAAVTLIAIGLAIGSVVLATGWMTFRTSRLDLLNPASSFNQRWLAYLDEFGDQDDVVVVLDGPNEATVIAALDDLACSLRADDSFLFVMHQVDLSSLHRKSLHYFSPTELQQVETFVDRFGSVLDGDWSQLTIANMLATRAQDDTGNAEELQRFVDAFRDDEVISPKPAHFERLTELRNEFRSRHLLLNDGRRGMLLLRITAARSDAAAMHAAIESLRTRIALAQERHPTVGFGITGMPILEHDEMAASQRDTTKASMLSLAGVAIVFVAGFGGLRRPMLAVAALLLGIAWSFGYITLAVGHLNILSVAFGVILIGLGIDFGIHYLARYLQLRERHHDPNEALIETARSVGPGIVTGGLTTALAFSTAALTEFTGVAELGIVAGGGLLLCIAAALCVLPAMLAISERGQQISIRETALPFAAICRSVSRLPKLVILITISVTIVIGYGITKLRYDHNLLNLQPRNQESVEIERKLAATSDRSVWFAVSMCEDRAQLLERKALLEAAGAVTATEEIASLLPSPDISHQQTIEKVRRRLASLPEMPPTLPVISRDALLAALSTQPRRPEAINRNDSTRELIARLQGLTPQEYVAKISRFQQTSAETLLATLRELRSISDPEPPAFKDIPGSLVHRYVGRRGRHLLRIYGNKDIWNMESLREFVAAVEEVDPRATGHPIQTFYASQQMQQSYVHAAIYSLLAVAIVLMLDFRNIAHTLLAMLPMGLGFVQLLGLLGWLDIPLNPANMIVLPLILGIGIDDGVHVVHDFLRQRSDYQISRSTATGVFLTSATTMIGFGSMMIASHAGLRSLGQVLTIGVFCCLVSSVFVLPVLLGWRTDSPEGNDD